MYFITGGRCSGKRDYVRSRFGLEPKNIFDGDFSGAVYGLHSYVKRLTEEGADVSAHVKELVTSGVKVIISDEVGCGIVPADEFESRWRDNAGSASQTAAEYAEGVIRVVCGIGVRLK